MILWCTLLILSVAALVLALLIGRGGLAALSACAAVLAGWMLMGRIFLSRRPR